MYQPHLVQISTGHSWKDLVISQDSHSRLNEISEWIISEEKRRITPAAIPGRSGKGLKVLFDGPANTLKDITAVLIGKEAGWPVYRIGLSVLVSEYIGETEKNIAAVFKKAENKNWILFFDEADALFGKRRSLSELRNEKAETAYDIFLKQMEMYSGLVIMASNFKSNIDEAFIRRFQLVISLNGPDNKKDA